jgi:hypothetical protein
MINGAARQKASRWRVLNCHVKQSPAFPRLNNAETPHAMTENAQTKLLAAWNVIPTAWWSAFGFALDFGSWRNLAG